MSATRITQIVEVLEHVPGEGIRTVAEQDPVRGLRFKKTAIPGVVVVEPKVHGDKRGFFLETHHQEKYAAGGIDETFVQDNHSRSARRTLRGLHAQLETPQGKLLRVVEGEIFDVAVDVRGGSPTCGKWFGIELSASNFRQLYVPPGLLHGFWVRSKVAQVEYKCTAFYAPDDQVAVRWDDSDLAIRWPGSDPVLSDQDRQAKPFREWRDLLARSVPFPTGDRDDRVNRRSGRRRNASAGP